MDGVPSDCGTWLYVGCALDDCPGYALIYDQGYCDHQFLVPQAKYDSVSGTEAQWAVEDWEAWYAQDNVPEGTAEASSTTGDSEDGSCNESAGEESDDEPSSSTSGSDCSADRKEDAAEGAGEYAKCHYCGEYDYGLEWFSSGSLLKRGWACNSCSSLDYNELVEQAQASMQR